MSIKPTIGRQVWFFPNNQDVKDGVDFREQPLAATVVYVHNDLFLNLQVLDATGQAWLFEDVPLFQTDKPWDYFDRCAQWMPYQRAQVEKVPGSSNQLTDRNP
jgi:hypothetical protein